jgi:hypothetical protein
MLDELVHGDATATALDVLREEEDDGVSQFDRRVTSVAVFVIQFFAVLYIALMLQHSGCAS